MAPGGYDAVLLDIEGTTTPISYVHDELFPYVARNVAQFLEARWDEPEVQKHVRAIAEQANRDVEAGIAAAIGVALDGPQADSADEVRRKVLANIEWQMKADRKIGALKGLQGYMWKFGYEGGELRGAMYPDAVAAMKRWTAAGRKVYIYSSGSVEAQKLIFGYTDHGCLLEYISGYYDTAVGPKIESASYVAIAAAIGAAPERILFVSDNIHEIRAADKAGMQTVVSIRPGNMPIGECDFVCSSDFLDIAM
ncbi:enolase-phosphatase E1 [Coemansia nantahalensis]|uniref:Enolase-phosphatase E1 n=1 Tax=Coemansia nantahalensis TaxID=2789366 RepID=A0ACC1K892_9FUNG|nr:enolase-phosphatase E1 [Coemansia nantahalensis]KAJ2775525.1 enolase-phosphatase E1 [Coemansia nantahalensis]